MPDPETNAASRRADPIISASVGAPVTVTARSNRTRTRMSAPRPYDPPAGGALSTVTPATAGADKALPSTRWPEALVTPFAGAIVRVAAVVESYASLIVPPFSPSAPTPTLMPSASASTPPVPPPPEPVPCTM